MREQVNGWPKVCAEPFVCEGQIYFCTFTHGHYGFHGRIELLIPQSREDGSHA